MTFSSGSPEVLHKQRVGLLFLGCGFSHGGGDPLFGNRLFRRGFSLRGLLGGLLRRRSLRCGRSFPRSGPSRSARAWLCGRHARGPSGRRHRVARSVPRFRRGRLKGGRTSRSRSAGRSSRDGQPRRIGRSPCRGRRARRTAAGTRNLWDRGCRHGANHRQRWRRRRNGADRGNARWDHD